MAQPAPAQASGPRYAPGYWPPSRLLMFLAAALFVVSALSFAFGGVSNDLGPGFAWLAGGFAAMCLSWAMP